MKILYDHQIFTWQKYGGISRYFTEIISNLPKDVNTEIAIKYSDNEYLKKSELVNGLESLFQPKDHFFPGIKFPLKRKLFKYIRKTNPESYPDSFTLNKELSIELLKKQDFDIFHPTYYDDYFLEYLGKKPFVLTIHDMIHEIYPELMNDPNISEKKAILAAKAIHIIAVSDRTKNDIVEILGISPNKISVVYHANSLTKVTSNNEYIPAKFILFVGERHIYKNFIFFVRSIESILKENSNLFVFCVGRDFSADESQLLFNLGIKHQFISRYCNDEELASLYKKAIALIFPSYYEGFGIPIIEAFQAGCPVILSNSSCFPEIAQDAALYFNPKNINEIKAAIEIILSDESLRNKLVEKGYSRVKTFSWEISAKRTADIYKTVNV